MFVSTESTSCHEFASQFASQFALAIFYTRKTSKNYREFRVAHAIVYLNDPATPVSAVMVERHRPVGPATTAPGGALRDKSHRCPRPVKMATLTVYYFTP